MAHLVGGRVSEGSDFLYIVDIRCFTLFEFIACVSKVHFVCLVACFLLLFEKAVFKKAKNLVIYIVTYQTVQFLNSFATFFCPHFFFFFVVLPSL